MDWRAEALSALHWWRDAGVDVLVTDDPRDWTARESVRSAPPPSGPVVAEPEPEVPLPVTLEGFVDWRYGAGAPEASWDEPILTAQGDPAAPLMLLTDLPEEADGTEAGLLTGPTGRLLDAMLAAIGMDRTSVYLVPFCAARPITGQIPPEVEQRLAELALHHIALSAPRHVLLLGQTVSRAVLGADAGAQRGRLHAVNHQDGQSMAVATLHPRFLLDRPARKADVWKDLQLLIGEQKS